MTKLISSRRGYLVVFAIVCLLGLAASLSASAKPAIAGGDVFSDTVNHVSVPDGTFANVATLSLPKGNYQVWAILGGSNGAVVNCNVVIGSYHMFDFSGYGEASFIAGVAKLAGPTTIDLSCDANQSNVSLTFVQLQAQQVGSVKGQVNHD